MTEVYTLTDVLVNGPFEGETLYNKALKYGRLEIAATKRKTAEFEENVRKYEETGLQLYKDKATGRYYHMILWDEIIRRLREELDAPKPYQFNCYACTAHCKACPIVERAGQCSDENSAYYKFSTALDRGDRDTAIKYAEVMTDAWTK